MSSSEVKQRESAMHQKRNTDYDVVVIGAGFAGMGMLYKLRELGLSSLVLEEGDGVGGTWYWNRYPGARTDSESYYYCFSFTKELLEEWEWSERYPGWPEMLEYLNYFAKRYDLSPDIRFNTRISSMNYDERGNRWILSTKDGAELSARFVISGMGVMSTPYTPPFKGLDSFNGEWHMTARWPHRSVDLRGKRVGVIGTGATGIQLIPVVAEQAAHLTVFQRTPQYVIEAQNGPVNEDRRKERKENYEEIWRTVFNHPFAMPFKFANRRAMDVSPEERQRIYEEGWRKGGFRFIFETFDDVTTDMEANYTASEFVRGKIRETVKNPKVAEMLSPKDYPLGAKRVPAGHRYWEAYNRDNVSLIDIKSSPIEEFTGKGLRTRDAEYQLDTVLFATGFDAFTGALTSVDIYGRDGIKLGDRWRHGPVNYLGLASHGFPNMFTITGPQSPFANIPTCIEKHIDWIVEALKYMRDKRLDYIEPTREAELAWGEHTREVIKGTVMNCDSSLSSWFMGTNIPGKAPIINVYFGGADRYFREIDNLARNGFRGFNLQSAR